MPSRNEQLTLPFGPIRNNEFLSNHWLEHRLPLEPEWNELQEVAKKAAAQLLDLWRVEKERVEIYGDEAGLEEKFIQPIFQILGWRSKYQTYLQSREPDYALFLDDASLNWALRAGRRSPDFWSHATLVADAKAWHVSLDRPLREGARREYPPEQIEWYLDRSRRDYGILTNGRLWRLVPRQLGFNKPRFQTYIEVDLPRLLEAAAPPSAELQLGPGGEEFATFLQFFLLFSPHAFISIEGRKPLIIRAVEGSSEYSLCVGEELKERVFEALRLCVEGFIKYPENELDRASDLRLCQENSFVFLYRLLFIMYAEDRGLLPYRINSTYTRNRSLARHRDEVALKLDNLRRGLDRVGYSLEETQLWEDLKDLFDLIDRGHRSYGVPAYNGGLFNLEGNNFLATKALPDWYLARVLDKLGRAPQPGRPGSELFRVDYRDLAIQQLGSVYEGLLELNPRYAERAMKVVRSRRAGPKTELVIPATAPVPQGFEAIDLGYPADSVYLATDKGERRRSGSYYTPDHIVNHIVQSALGAACRDLYETLKDEIAETELSINAAEDAERPFFEARLQKLMGSFDDRVLTLKVLDPAMGSGHFLIRACQYLAEEIATNPYTSDPFAEGLPGEESTITYWKRRVAESCLYGVDINPMAVELAKLALWLETVASDAALTFLDHHLRCGDSVIGARVKRLNSLPEQEGLLSGEFEQQIRTALPSLLDPLREISALRSDTAEQVKRKEQLFGQRFMPVLARFAAVGDLWCSSALNVSAAPMSSEHYAEVVGALGSRRKFEAVLNADWAQDRLGALRELGIRCFHWELAFPEVFLDNGANGRARGFDIIAGNPPYDVLAERESGEAVALVRRFVEQDPAMDPSRVGKNNLYKIFICRALELVREGGYVSFIVPMPLLGDEQASGIRRALVSAGTFLEIHAFPQKDDPTRRVFYDAKLSTALFVYRKQLQADETCRFVSAVHPAQYIEASSPNLRPTTSDVELYDPSNLTIVSCSQDDWDLATRIVTQPGICRLGYYCESYQGEVNETNERERGVLYETDGPGRRLVLRGSNVCMYVLREASQGEAIYIDPEAFRAGRRAGSKAYHGLVDRVGFQRSSPQNNYRRIIATYIPAGEYCFDTISYIPRSNATRLSLEFLLALLNSKLLDWYFRLGSTNSKVNEYQFNNLPCPVFREEWYEQDNRMAADAREALDGEVSVLQQILSPGWATAPFSPAIHGCVEHLTRRIFEFETQRGNISRQRRSRLCEQAQPYQDALDQILFKLAGLSDHEIEGLEVRLSQML